MQIQIFKFGGSSLNEAKHISKAADIVASAKSGLVVVVSAMGGVTDLLLMGKDFGEFERRHREVTTALDLKIDGFEPVLDRGVAERLASGERLMAKIMVALLEKRGVRAIYVDAPEIIKTKQGPTGLVHDQAQCSRLINDRLRPLLEQGFFPVVPGFIAAGPEGELVTLGRGGSDYSATILAASLEASQVTLYKEVDGLLSADPKYVSKPKLISELGYQEAAELSYYGAKILHPRSIIPLIRPQIPLFLKNTFYPERPGTRIGNLKSNSSDQKPVKALTAITGQTLISIEGCGMMGVPGVAMRTFKAMGEARISVSLISQASSEASICFTVLQSEEARALEALNSEFKFELQNQLIERIQVTSGVAIVACVGIGMKGYRGLSARVFGAFRHANVNIMAIAQGSSEFNISLVIAQAEVPLAIQTLHHEFFGSEVPNEVQVVLHGFGQIAQALTQQVISQEDYLRAQFGVAIGIRALSDSKGARIFKDIAAREELSALIDEKKSGALVTHSSEPVRFDLLGVHHGICVDLTAAESHEILMQALQNGFDVVLANKKPLTGPYARYKALFETAKQNQCQIRYEATVGAGLPIIDTITKLKQAGDTPLSIEGCFSGTLGYLMSALDTGAVFSKAVLQAKALGLTEPDPKDDLCGMDVARKALILARELGWNLELSDVETQSLADLSDDEMAELVSKAHAAGKRLRYIARVVPGQRARVGLEEVGSESPFYYLVGTTNQISLRTPRYLDSPLVVTGPGAGAGVTAAGVLNDLVSLAVRARV